MLDRDETVRREANELEERLEEGQKEVRSAKRRYDDAVEERDGVQNVINGYQLRMEARRKKAEGAKDAHMKLQMEESALTSRIKLLTCLLYTSRCV